MIFIIHVTGGVKGLFNIVPEGLQYVSPAKRYLFEWSEISNIFPWKKPNALTVIDVNGETSTGMVFGDRKHGNSWKKMDYIFKIWGEKIKESMEEVYFEYPSWCREKEVIFRRENVYWGFGGGLIILLMVLAAMRSENWWPLQFGDDWPIAMAFLFAIFGFVFGGANWKKLKQKDISQIEIDDSGLNVIYEDGNERQFYFSQVKKHHLSKRCYKGKMIFEDGSELEHLERLSYWPILREYLLSRLEPLKEG